MELSITITKIQVYLVRPDNMPRSTHKCLNIYYPSFSYFDSNCSILIGQAKRAPHWGVQSRFRVIYVVGMLEVCLSYVKLTAWAET